MTQDEEILTALQQFVAEKKILADDGQYMRYMDGRPIALDVAMAKEVLRRLLPTVRAFEWGWVDQRGDTGVRFVEGGSP